jgi:hypothetical protein
MPDQLNSNQDAVHFAEKVRKPHRRINPCFMTGKGCVHTEHIDSELQRREGILVGFNVRPFQPNIETAHRLSLHRFLAANYSNPRCKLEVGQADKVRRIGYVVCEKICRRIQASDFVIVDISAPNANVFYELGLAYGIDQKILVIHHQKAKDEKGKDGVDFGQRASNCLKEGGCRPFPYTDLEPIGPADFILSNYLWTRKPLGLPQNRPAPTIVLLSQSYGFLAWAGATSEPQAHAQAAKANETNPDQRAEVSEVDRVLGSRDIPLGFETHVKAAVGVAVDNILENMGKLPAGAIMRKYINLVEGLKSTDQIKRDAGFQEVRQKVEQSFCTIIQTGGKVSDPMAYFWLGYCHALGKNVIPVTVVEKTNDAIDDLAFDLRALWHMSFARQDPAAFSREIEDTLQQMIASDFAEWSRKQFWDEILGRRGKVSIFTGALHNAPIGREMIGDWDLRSASELTSYFASHQYRATIESPVYQIEQVTGAGGRQAERVTEKEYISELEQMLRGKNCIVIASPDVNPLTELLLGKLYDVEREKWFKSGNDADNRNGAVIAFKEVELSAAHHSDGASANRGKDSEIGTLDLARAFYRQIRVNQEQKGAKGLKRGFLGHGVKGGRLEGAFLSQTDEKSQFNVHAHLVVARNPFDEGSLEPHHIILLNGVSGPATFALTHVLTGGTSTQFVAYPDTFLPDSESEGFLQQLNQDIEMIRARFLGIQYFFSVEVGPTREAAQGGSSRRRDIFDWRRIVRWERGLATADCAFGQGSSANG